MSFIYDSFSTTFSRTMTVLAMLNAICALGVWTTYGSAAIIGTTAGIVMLVVMLFATLFLTNMLAAENNMWCIPTSGVFAYLEGLLLGPFFASYADRLGTGTVMTSYLATVFVLAVMGFIACLVSFDYRKVSNWLLIALLGLILVSCVNLFVAFSAGANLLISIVGMVVFAAFFLVDMMMVRDTQISGWGQATTLAINLFLDIVNFMIYLLKFLGVSLSDD